MMLADMGADVIKVEEPGKGDYIRWMPPLVGGVSSGHIALNRNKRSLSLNLKSPEGADLLRRMARSADVLVESFRPGVMARLGVGWESLREENPRLVYCAITGYGQDGPRRDEAGHDANYVGLTGLLGATGPEGGPPVLPAMQVGDLGGGGMAAVSAILLALLVREQSGEGDLCDVSMTDGAFSWLSIHGAAFQATGEEPQRGLMHLSGAFPCYRIYPAADGWLAVGALEPRFWSTLCDALHLPGLVDDAFAQGDRRTEVIGILEDVFGRKSRAAWVEELSGLDVCVTPVNGFEEAYREPQMKARGMVQEGDVPGVGAWRHVATPIRTGGVPFRTDRLPPPGLGEHTDEILASVGLRGPEIASLRDAGVV